MYLSKDLLLESIRKLGNVHPFFGITFLSCKRNLLPVGETTEFPMDGLTRSFMEEVHRLSPTSEYYFQPYRSNARNRWWVTSGYPSSGLQAINTQTFSQAFLHARKDKNWGWQRDYVEFLETYLMEKNSGRLPMLALAIWVLKSKRWPQNVDPEMILDHFVDVFHITREEEARLFIRETGIRGRSLLQDRPATWQELRPHFADPPDATPGRGATLSFLKIDNIGPTKSMTFEPKQRLNIITGDNGLGKSFLMECAWWALTGTWPEIAAHPSFSENRGKPSIAYELASEHGVSSRATVTYDPKRGSWPRSEKAPSTPGLTVYARVDGSYAVWDPIKQYGRPGPSQHVVFSRSEVWNGVTGSIEGLMRDWVKWQSTPEKYPFETLTSVLHRMSPPDMGDLHPGQPVRMLDDIRDIPTIVHPYGPVPIVYASAGVRRIVTLAYLIVWAWFEHKVAAELRRTKPERRMVIVIDEIEAHLHPKWQRAILPSLLDIQSLLSRELEIQFIVSTHSPLVLASAESFFSSSADSLYHLSANPNTGEAELADLDFVKYGHINSWLTSPIFSLGQARSQEAEKAINIAKRLQLQRDPDRLEIEDAHRLLLRELSETDPFWPRWLFFAEKNGVTI